MFLSLHLFLKINIFLKSWILTNSNSLIFWINLIKSHPTISKICFLVISLRRERNGSSCLNKTPSLVKSIHLKIFKSKEHLPSKGSRLFKMQSCSQSLILETTPLISSLLTKWSQQWMAMHLLSSQFKTTYLVALWLLWELISILNSWNKLTL